MTTYLTFPTGICIIFKFLLYSFLSLVAPYLRWDLRYPPFYVLTLSSFLSLVAPCIPSYESLPAIRPAMFFFYYYYYYFPLFSLWPRGDGRDIFLEGNCFLCIYLFFIVFFSFIRCTVTPFLPLSSTCYITRTHKSQMSD